MYIFNTLYVPAWDRKDFISTSRDPCLQNSDSSNYENINIDGKEKKGKEKQEVDEDIKIEIGRVTDKESD